MPTDQSICCPICKGVLIARQFGDYTAIRGRLVVSNGYCRGRCPASEQLSGPGDPGQDGSRGDRPARQPKDMSSSAP